MFKKVIRRFARAVVVVCCLIVVIIAPVVAKTDIPVYRRNVMIVMDASSSLHRSDPEKLRLQAVKEFVGLLATEGNYLGGLVFSNHIEAKIDPFEIKNQKDKTKVLSLLEKFDSPVEATNTTGYTNIGEALLTAVQMLQEHGNPDLESVIIFVSDGNTEMPTREEVDESNSYKEEAIANASGLGISVYTVCLNADGGAREEEMYQISNGTGGKYQIIQKPSDLKDAMDYFYTMIYKNGFVDMGDYTFDHDGKIIKTFYVPGFGIEEINMIIYGKFQSSRLINPRGIEPYCSSDPAETFTIIKTDDVFGGEWTLELSGNPDDTVSLKLIVNPSFYIEAGIQPDVNQIKADEECILTARFGASGGIATEQEQYEGFQNVPVLHILDNNQKEITSMDMTFANNEFEAKYTFEADKSYYIYVAYTDEFFKNVESNRIGPFRAGSESENASSVPQRQALPPEPGEEKYEFTVNVWPILGGKLDIDLSGMAVDPQQDTLTYTIDNTPYIEGLGKSADYTVDGNVIRMHHFSMGKGFFDIKATNTYGLSCIFRVNVIRVQVAYWIVGTIIVVVIAVLAFLAYQANQKRLYGEIKISSNVNNKYTEGKNLRSGKGRIKLSRFKLEPSKLKYGKSYIQCTGKDYVELVTDKQVTVRGSMSTKHRINSGVNVIAYIPGTQGDYIEIYFVSKLNNMHGASRGSARNNRQDQRRR